MLQTSVTETEALPLRGRGDLCTNRARGGFILGEEVKVVPKERRRRERKTLAVQDLTAKVSIRCADPLVIVLLLLILHQRR